MTTSVLSIGSNIGDRLGFLRVAVGVFEPWLSGASPVYETPPWGPIDQQAFLNAVLLVEDAAAGPKDWLARARQAETQAQRIREVRWGPRTLDVDVITVDDVRSDDPELILPHPRAAQRAFVLVPWLSLDPGAALPQGPVGDLIAGLDPDEVAGMVVRPELVLRG
jgi:2-amino-4-hydroxy-6-hydroxymethyldihydropteridine diphosphokinase